MKERAANGHNLEAEDEFDSVMGRIWARFKRQKGNVSQNLSRLDTATKHLSEASESELSDLEILFEDEDTMADSSVEVPGYPSTNVISSGMVSLTCSQCISREL